NEVPVARGHVGHRLVRLEHPLAVLGLDVEVVPFHASNLTSLAANAGRRVDEHGKRFRLAHGRLRKRRGDSLDLQRAAHEIFASFTRNVLYSGVKELGSTTLGVRRFAMGPFPLVSPSLDPLARPAKPQWIGIATCQTVLPDTLRGEMRLVTS